MNILNNVFCHLFSQCGGDFYYGMDWFDALACCYLQVVQTVLKRSKNNLWYLSLIDFFLQKIMTRMTFMSLLSFQRGYLAEPLSEEEQTKINTYLTICKNTFVVLVSTYLKSCFQCSDMLVSLQKVMFVFQQTVETCRTPGGLEALTCTRRWSEAETFKIKF